MIAQRTAYPRKTNSREPATTRQRIYFLWLIQRNARAILPSDRTKAEMSELISEQYATRKRLGLEPIELPKNDNEKEAVMRRDLPTLEKLLKKIRKAL